MLEGWFAWMAAHGAWAPWIVFGSICLTGACFPISEDLVILGSGWLAATVMPERAVWLFIGGLAGAYIADWLLFSCGRGLLHVLRLLSTRWHAATEQKIRRLQPWLQRHSGWVLIGGRFVPFGFRTALFLAAGFSQVPPLRFALLDAVACLLVHTCLFGGGYFGGIGWEAGAHYWYRGVLLVALASALLLLSFFCLMRRRSAS